MSLLTPALLRMSLDDERPMPKMYVRPTSTRLFSGRSTPAIRAILSPVPGPGSRVPSVCFSLGSGPRDLGRFFLSLSLFVFRIHADDPDDSLPPDDLALTADSFD